VSHQSNKNRWDKTHKEPEFNIGDQVLLSTINFNNLGGNRKLKPAFVGPFVIKKLQGKNAVEVLLSEELCKCHGKDILMKEDLYFWTILFRIDLSIIV